MTVFEILLIGIALSMDAVAVGMTNGMVEPKMRPLKMFLSAGAYGFFQFFMPVLGYGCGYAFAALVEKIAPVLSFILLGTIGGKMIFDFFRERARKGDKELFPSKPLGAGKLLAQAFATSIDALAVGVAMLAAQTKEGLPFSFLLCSLIIGAVTFVLSFGAIALGKRVGDRFSDRAGLIGGVILVAIGIKLLVEGLLP